MDINYILNFMLFNILMIVIFHSAVASLSYAFYVRKTGASRELQNRFQANLNPPFKWLFWGKKPFFEHLVLSTTRRYKDFEDYIENTPLSLIHFYRITNSTMSLLPTLMIFVFLVLPEKDLIGRFTIHLIVQVLILVVSFRFGHKLTKKEILQ